MSENLFSDVDLGRRKLMRSSGAAMMTAVLPFADQVPDSIPRVQADSFQTFDPLLFGAKGNGNHKDTQGIQAAIDACSAAGGGTVVLRPGRTFLAGTITLRSHVHLYLAAGSTLRASPDRDDFRALGSLLFANGSEDIHVSGTGVIDGNFAAFFSPKGPDGYAIPQPFLGPYDPLYPPARRNPPDGRPRMMVFVDCKRVLLDQFTIRDSPTWTVHLIGCQNVHMTGLSILNDLEVPNCDGIDIDHCRKVIIDNCNIVAGDDCLVLKASRNFGDYGLCEEVAITNCTLESSSAGIKVETEGRFPLRSVVVKGCTIVRSNRGISFLNRDGAVVEDLLFSDLVIETKMRSMMWWGSGEPVALSSVPREKGGSPGLVRNITFTNLLCRGENGIYLRGTQESPLENIAFRGVDLLLEKTTAFDGGFYDMRPGDMFGESGLDRRQTAGVFAAAAKGLQLSDIRVQWSPNAPKYYGAALELHDCVGTIVSNVFGSAARSADPATVLDNTSFARPLLLNETRK